MATEVKPDSNGTLEVKDSSDFDEPLIVVNNPFKRILKWLYDIRKRQTTKFSINLNIPLLPFISAVGIVVAIVLVFVFGTGLRIGQITITRELLMQPTPTAIVVHEPTSAPLPYELSKIGIIKSTYQYKLPSATPEPLISGGETSTPSAAIPLQPVRFVLLDQNGNYVFLSSSSVDFSKYINDRVLITGLYNVISNILTVSSTDFIENLP